MARRVLTSGAGLQTTTLALYAYRNAFGQFEIGYGSAIAVFLFLAILILTAIQFRLSRRWVFYQ